MPQIQLKGTKVQDKLTADLQEIKDYQSKITKRPDETAFSEDKVES